MPHSFTDRDNLYSAYTRQESDGWAGYMVVSNPKNGPDKVVLQVNKLPSEESAREVLLTISRRLGIEVPAS